MCKLWQAVIIVYPHRSADE